MSVVNVRDLRGSWPEGTIYIGRNPEIWRRSGGQGAPPWGNPFPMKDERDRLRVVSDYTDWLADKIAKEPRFRAEVASLVNSNLACHCAPRACHGHILRDAATALSEGRDWTGREVLPIYKRGLAPVHEGPDTRVMRAALDAGLPDAFKTHPDPEAAALRDAYRTLATAMKQAGRLEGTNEGGWEIRTDSAPTPETKKAGLAAASLQRLLAQAASALPDAQRSPLAKSVLDADARLADANARQAARKPPGSDLEL